MSKSEITYRILAAMAWIKGKGWGGDDDYAQTILIAQSLIENKGFNHKNLVEKFRGEISEKWKQESLGRCGVGVRTYLQAYELLKSDDPLYVSKNGITDGGAMRVSPLAAHYHSDLYQLVDNVRSVTRITHSAPEGILSAVLVALRFWRIIRNENCYEIDDLVDDFEEAIGHLQLKREACYFMKIFRRAVEIAKDEPDSDDLIVRLAQEVGLFHWGWCCPIAACLWSYSLDENYHKHYNISKKSASGFDVGGVVLTGRCNIRPEVFEEYEKYIALNRPLEPRRPVVTDRDTLFILAFGMAAGLHGISNIESEVIETTNKLGDDLRLIASELTFD